MIWVNSILSGLCERLVLHHWLLLHVMDFISCIGIAWLQPCQGHNVTFKDIGFALTSQNMVMSYVLKCDNVSIGHWRHLRVIRSCPLGPEGCDPAGSDFPNKFQSQDLNTWQDHTGPTGPIGPVGFRFQLSKRPAHCPSPMDMTTGECFRLRHVQIEALLKDRGGCARLATIGQYMSICAFWANLKTWNTRNFS